MVVPRATGAGKRLGARLTESNICKIKKAVRLDRLNTQRHYTLFKHINDAAVLTSVFSSQIGAQSIKESRKVVDPPSFIFLT